MATSLDIQFYGVRGSTPCACPENLRYGGNTASVALTGDGFDPILFDLGTGVRYFGIDWGCEFVGTALVSHLHWDHIQGLPFFTSLHHPDSKLEIVGPTQDQTLEATVDSFLCPPYFPVGLDDLAAEFTFRELTKGSFESGSAKITAAPIPHCGLTLGYRVDVNGFSVAYLSDHQQPGIGSTEIAPDVLELCAGVDVLIHDAQYTDEEFALRSTWGHCTVDYAVEVGARCEVDQLVLFHHDPAHGDDEVDSLEQRAQRLAQGRPISSVVAAAEGLKISL